MKESRIPSRNLTVGKEIRVTGAQVGGFKDGDIISPTDLIETVLEKLLTKESNVTYTTPTGSISSTVTGNVEAGTVITPTITPTFNRNDAGALTKYVLKRGSTVLLDAVLQNVQDSVTIGDASISYQASFSYAAGAVKNTNLGNPSPQGAIQAGTVNSNTVTISGKRYAFYDVDKPTATSNDIRNLSGKVMDISQGNSFTINIPAGTESVEFAYMDTLRDVSKVIDEATNLDVKGVFTKNNQNVAGANNFSPIGYKVYRYTPVVPFNNATRYIVTI
ncbi:hypothetical protein EFA69_06540 [Rufibacter immobilis]|uniref:Uncharacterized protein n=1 Tax=Rufibacter immobilis TaxID=1348778 RepID=A0A3M9N0N1_9BACT|nr:hypothetical protein [Rufibacter immobilis]RNI30945.1 hypothetical protein EFA69_06540 [Rufibacter immobilis]